MNFPLYCLDFGNRPLMLGQTKIRGKTLGILPVFTTPDAAEQFGNHLPPDVASKLPSERIRHLQSREELAAVLLVAKDARCAFVAWDPEVPSAKSGRKQPLSELLAGLRY
jgi:hypothetical protein